MLQGFLYFIHYVITLEKEAGLTQKLGMVLSFVHKGATGKIF